MLSLNAKDYFDSRAEERAAFVRNHAGEGALIAPLAADWASRRYFRVINGKETRVLMEAIPDHTKAFTPGHSVGAFLKIARALRQKNIHAPEIFAQDEQNGYVLLEDMGDVSVYAALENGEDPDVLYRAATDVLIHIKNNFRENKLSLPSYYESHVHKGRQRLVDWYIPATRSALNPDGLVESYLDAWKAVENSLPPCPQGFVHGDYHAQNLMRLDDDLGVLDFQGAMWGPLPYDLANLLEDIRRDIPADIRAAMLARYDGGDDFAAWYRVLATQFHCRILGQTLRLAIAGNRPDFLKFIPRVQNYIREGLKNPVLAPLNQWMKSENINLEAEDCFDPETVRRFIRGDAF
jgi:N-acetylmuramate 1-kinase